jgi:hypothetical protein
LRIGLGFCHSDLKKHIRLKLETKVMNPIESDTRRIGTGLILRIEGSLNPIWSRELR